MACPATVAKKGGGGLAALSAHFEREAGGFLKVGDGHAGDDFFQKPGPLQQLGMVVEPLQCGGAVAYGPCFEDGVGRLGRPVH
jgi:hypothetical protein